MSVNILDAVKFYEENYLAVNIYYGKMSYHELDEELAYDIFDMVGK